MQIKKNATYYVPHFFVPCPIKRLAMAENYQSRCIFLGDVILEASSLGGVYSLWGDLNINLKGVWFV